MSDPEGALIDAVRRAIVPAPERLGVAVSGGGDSTALLAAVVQALPETQVFAATVDHGLRPGSRGEAIRAGQRAQALGVAHDILTWEGWDGRGNVQAMARAARYRLLVDWAHTSGLSSIALGHTMEDQAETMLMRLARRSGVDGLSGIPPRRKIDGIAFIRPFLTLRRAALRAYLRQQDMAWEDEPSNEDPRFDRIRMRQSAELLDRLGLTSDALAEVAQNMALAREALEHQTALAARQWAVRLAGDIDFDVQGLSQLPGEILRRLVVAAVIWVAGLEYPPRRAAVAAALAQAMAGQTASLGGCLLVPWRGRLRVCREYKAVQEETCGPQDVWDNRFVLCSDDAPPDGCLIRALGPEGLAACPNWRDTGHPRESLLSAPSLWCAATLIAAPMAGFSAGHRFEHTNAAELFTLSNISH